MKLEQQYADILQQLQQGGRALKKFSPAEMQELGAGLNSPDAHLEKVLCLVAHSAYPERTWEPALLKLLQQTGLAPALLVQVLAAARKHIIQARFKEGFRLDLPFLESLRVLLRHPDLDVVEWTLRTLEECGAQSVLLAEDVRRLRPSVFSLWRAQSRTILELVTLLQRRWEPTHVSQTR